MPNILLSPRCRWVNILMVLSTGCSLVVTRTLFSAVMHGAATSLVGAATGLGKLYRGSLRTFFGCVGMALAMGMHGLWNGLLVTEIIPGKEMLQLSKRLGGGVDMEPFLYSAFFFVVELVIVLLIFCSVYSYGKGASFVFPLNKRRKKLIPQEHVPYLASYWMRQRKRLAFTRYPKMGVYSTGYTPCTEGKAGCASLQNEERGMSLTIDVYKRRSRSFGYSLFEQNLLNRLSCSDTLNSNI